MDDYISVLAASKILHLSRQRTYKYVEDGRLPCRYFLGKLGVKKADVLRLKKNLLKSGRPALTAVNK